MANDGPAGHESAQVKESEARYVALQSLSETSKRFGQALPVESWNPPFCGDIDMKIARDGTWFYEGSPIGRPAMVKLFSRLLRKDPERYVLVTPAECVGIAVEDVPFLAVEMETLETAAGQSFRFRTNVDDFVEADAGHPLRFDMGAAEGIVPYVLVRGGLWARLTRSLALELIDRGVTQDVDGMPMFGIASAGAFFGLAPAADWE